jgi:hypothetical protein
MYIKVSFFLQYKNRHLSSQTLVHAVLLRQHSVHNAMQIHCTSLICVFMYTLCSSVCHLAARGQCHIKSPCSSLICAVFCFSVRHRAAEGWLQAGCRRHVLYTMQWNRTAKMQYILSSVYLCAPLCLCVVVPVAAEGWVQTGDGWQVPRCTQGLHTPAAGEMKSCTVQCSTAHNIAVQCLGSYPCMKSNQHRRQKQCWAATLLKLSLACAVWCRT